MGKQKNFKERGITLVAMVITIIILLILAGVSIATLTESGLFNKAKEAKQKSENAQIKEETTLGNYENSINKYISSSRLEGESLIFSQNERIVGKWIDNKDIYAKTIPVTALNSGAWNQVCSINNVDTLVDMTGKLYLLYSAGYYLWLNIDGGTGASDAYRIYSSVENNNVCIYIGNQYTFSTNSKGHITIYYTKTN